MKPQLRGRIRRNVLTLLELGAEVTVVNSMPREDFFLGLEHPHLRAHFIDATSLARRHAESVTRRTQRRRQRWDAKATTASSRGTATPDGLSVRRQPTAPRGRWRSLVRRSKAVRRALVRRRRRLHRYLIRRARALRRWRTTTTKNLLRPTHRVNRFVEFWYASSVYVRAQAPDLIVSSDLPGLVGASVAARRLRTPHVHDCHELYLESTALRPFERVLLRPVESRYLRRVDSIVMVNQTIADEYRHRYGVRSRVVRNCTAAAPASLPRVDLRARTGMPAGSHVVLYQGGFVEGRGLEVCIAAVRWFPGDAHLVLLGYGSLKADLVRLSASHGVQDRVHFLDAVLPQELASYTASASVGLIPYLPVSQNNLYALPNKAFEYTGVGVPLVASDLPELRRMTETSGCGRVYDPYRPEALAEAVRTVLSPARYDGFRDAARLYGRDNTWENERTILVEELSRHLPGSTVSAHPSPGPESRPREQVSRAGPGQSEGPDVYAGHG